MRTALIPGRRWQDCVEVLLRGGVVALPTDTVYGIAGLPSSHAAIEQIYEAKGRPAEKALPVLVSELRFAEAAGRFSARLSRVCRVYWPGALTVVVPARRGFDSPALNDDGTVGLRMPDDRLALAIIGAAGGLLAVTSANQSGAPPATTAEGVLAQLDGRIDAVVDGGPSRGGVASSVIRLQQGRLRILREGAVAPAQIRRAMMPPPTQG